MKTSYLLRNTPWMTDDERRTARYTARRAEQALTADGTPLHPLHTTAIYAVVTAHALLQRVQLRFAEALAGGGDLAALGAALESVQVTYLRAQQHLDALTHRAKGSTPSAAPQPTSSQEHTPSAAEIPGPTAGETPAASSPNPTPNEPPAAATAPPRQPTIQEKIEAMRKARRAAQHARA